MGRNQGLQRSFGKSRAGIIHYWKYKEVPIIRDLFFDALTSVVILFCKIFLGQLYYNAGQQEHGDEVRNYHQTVEGLGDAPHESKVHGSAHNSGEGVQHHERLVRAGAEEKFDTSGAVQSPADGGGEGEAAHSHGGENRYPVAVDSGEAADSQLRTGSFSVIYRYTAAQDY